MSKESLFDTRWNGPHFMDPGAQICDPRHEKFRGEGNTIDTGVVDARAALALADAEDAPIFLAAGAVFRVDSNLTLSGGVRSEGGMLRPANGVNITLNGPQNVGLVRYIDLSLGGTVTFGSGSVRKYLPQWWGARGDGTTEDHVALQAAVDAAEDVMGIVEVPPTALGYVLGATVTISECITFEAPSTRFVVNHAGHGFVAMRTTGNGSFGNESEEGHLEINIGVIQRDAATITTQDADSTGLKVYNAYFGRINVRSITYFRRGFHGLGSQTGTIPKGFTDTHIELGHLLCEMGLYLSSDTGGWCTANIVIGGRLYGSQAGAATPDDITHIRLEGADSNFFYGMTLEGVARHGVEFINSDGNIFSPMYYEMSEPIVDYDIDLDASSSQNAIVFGRGVADFVPDAQFRDLGTYNFLQYTDYRDGFVTYMGGNPGPGYDPATRTGSGKFRTQNRTGLSTGSFLEWYTGGLDGETLTTRTYSGVAVAMVLSFGRRIRLRCTANLASGGLVLSDVPSSPCLIEVSIEQNGGARTISSSFITGLRWGSVSRPTPLSGAEDTFVIRVISATSAEVVSHSRRASVYIPRLDVASAPDFVGEQAVASGVGYRAVGVASAANWHISTYTAGTTANRPATPATGLMYFDTTLGRPVWYSGAGWVDATGAAA